MESYELPIRKMTKVRSNRFKFQSGIIADRVKINSKKCFYLKSAVTLLDRVQESNAKWILCDPGSVEDCKWVASNVAWNVEIIVTGDVDYCTPLRDILTDDGSGR